MRHAAPQGAGASHTTIGITDLMTSLAIVFILLFAAQITKTSSAAQSELQENKEDVQTALRDHIQRLGLSLDADPRDPLALLIVVPENLLTFEFGKSTLSPTADQFLVEALPFYVGALCGPLRDKIDSLAIEGHTDDSRQRCVQFEIESGTVAGGDGEGPGGHSSHRAGFAISAFKKSPQRPGAADKT